MTVVFPRAAMTSAFVLFPMVTASLASWAEIVLAGVAVAVVTDDASGTAHPVTQVKNAYTTPA